MWRRGWGSQVMASQISDLTPESLSVRLWPILLKKSDFEPSQEISGPYRFKCDRWRGGQQNPYFVPLGGLLGRSRATISDFRDLCKLGGKSRLSVFGLFQYNLT